MIRGVLSIFFDNPRKGASPDSPSPPPPRKNPRGQPVPQLPVRNKRRARGTNRASGLLSPTYPGTAGLNDIIRTLRLSPRKYVIPACAKSSAGSHRWWGATRIQRGDVRSARRVKSLSDYEIRLILESDAIVLRVMSSSADGAGARLHVSAACQARFH